MKNSAVLLEARRLHALGCAVHWVRPKSKIPVEAGWTTGPRKTWEELERTYRDDYNVGIRLGTASKMKEGYLAVIDVDVKSRKESHRTEALTAAQNILGSQNTPVVLSGRGNGSCHFYFITEKPFKTFNAAVSKERVKVHSPSKKPSRNEISVLTEQEVAGGIRLANAWEVSLYSEGRQVVVPPSIHPDSGGEYRWEKQIGNGIALPHLSVSTVLHGLSGREGATGEGPLPPEAVLEDFTVTPVELGWLPISDRVRQGILEGEGVGDRSAFLLKAVSALVSSGLTRNEVLTVLTDPHHWIAATTYEHAKTKSRRRAATWLYGHTIKKVERERNPATVFTHAPVMRGALSPADQEKQAKEFAEDRCWKQDLDTYLDQRTKKEKTRITLKNLDLIFSHGVGGNIFIEDLFANRIEYGEDTPWGGKEKRYIEDIDLIRIKRWLADTEFQIEPNTGAILEATSLVADRCRRHPVREWLESLQWDGRKRIDTWIRDFCKGSASEPYLSQVSRKFLVAMVKRIFEPGCQWDYVLILEGPQGKFKSSIARALASDRWFMDNLPDLKDKDSMLNLQGKWLIELGELADVKRADYNLVKAYLIRRTDTVRPHYGRLKSDVPRQSVFIGTINEGQYLKDPTGNRRYWPVKVGLCDVAALLKVREQLFAEAMAVYRRGTEVLTLDRVATSQAVEAQEDRRVDDDETEMRDTFIAFAKQKGLKGDFPFYKFTIRENLMLGPFAPWGAWNDKKGYILNIGAHVLTKLGFVRFPSNGRRYWKFLPGSSRVISLFDDPVDFH